MFDFISVIIFILFFIVPAVIKFFSEDKKPQQGNQQPHQPNKGATQDLQQRLQEAQRRVAAKKAQAANAGDDDLATLFSMSESSEQSDRSNVLFLGDENERVSSRPATSSDPIDQMFEEFLGDMPKPRKPVQNSSGSAAQSKPSRQRRSLEGETLEGKTLEGATLEGSSLEGRSLEGSSLEKDPIEKAFPQYQHKRRTRKAAPVVQKTAQAKHLLSFDRDSIFKAFMWHEILDKPVGKRAKTPPHGR